MFVVLEKREFRSKDGSPALRLGITPITKYGIEEPSGLTEKYGYVGSCLSEVIRDRVAGLVRVQTSEGPLHGSHELETD